MNLPRHLFRTPFFLLFLTLISCGRDSGNESQDLCAAAPKIIGGQTCNDTRTIIKLVMLDEEDNPKICTATLLTPTKALTAAHCFDEFVFSYYAEVNSSRREVVSVQLHPEVSFFEDGTIRNDVAILELSGTSEPQEISRGGEIQIGDKIEIYGYGRSSDDPSSSGVLRKGEMTVTSLDGDFVRARFEGIGQNTCFGDSGGPVIQQASGRLVGIVSSGTNETCGVGDESIFVNLSSPPVQQFLDATLK